MSSIKSLVLYSLFFVLSANLYLASADDLSALKELYTLTGGPSWTNTTGWDGTNPCNFFGITCAGGRVTRVEIENNNLVGSLPNSIGELTQITDFKVGENKLTGSIPTSIINCGELLRFRVTSNQLTGSLPDFPLSVALIAADQNKLSGPLPTSLGSLRALETLALSNNNFTSLPASIAQLATLGAIYVNGNPIEADIGVILPQLRGLINLYADNCKFYGNFPDISGLRKIGRILLANNNVTGSLSSNIGASTDLNQLRLTNNRIRGSIPASIYNLTKLTELDLSGNFIERIEPPLKQTTLTSCRLGNNVIRCPIPAWATACSAVCDVSSNVTVSPSNALDQIQSVFQFKSSVFNIHLSAGSYESMAFTINQKGYELVRFIPTGSVSMISSTINVESIDQFVLTGMKMNESSTTITKVNQVFISSTSFSGSSSVNLGADVGSASFESSQFSNGNLQERIKVEGAMQKLSVRNCNFIQNLATSISITNPVQIVEFSSLKFSSNLKTNILVSGNVPQFSLTSSEFRDNFGSNLDVSNVYSLSIFSSSFIGNSNFSSLILRSGINGVQIDGSKWISNSEGAILLHTSSSIATFVASNCEFSNNTNGAISAEGTCPSFSISGTNFVKNTRSTDGGAVYVGPSVSPSLNTVVFDGNSGSKGGGLFSLAKNIAIQNSQFKNNSAASNGGGAYITMYASSQITSSNFGNNRANNEGGGLYLDVPEAILVSDIVKRQSKSITLKQVTFSDNSANVGGAARIYNVYGDSSHVVITESSLFRNNAELGSAISVNGSMSLGSTTFRDNTNPQNAIVILSSGKIEIGEGNQFGGASIYVSSDATATTFSYSDSTTVPLVCQVGEPVPDANGVRSCGTRTVITTNQRANIVPIAVGVSVGGVVLIALIAVILFLVLKRKSKRPPVQTFNFTLDMKEIAKEVVIDETDLKDMTKIGEGSFGIVYKAQWRQLNIAVKQMNLNSSSIGEKEMKDFLGEVNLLHSLRSHPNVVLFIGVVLPPQTLSLVTEFCHGGSLRQYILLNHKTTDMDTMKNWVSGIALGMLHLHSEGVIHRDLAARNILLTKNLDVKVSDFGLSRKQLTADDSGKTTSDIGPIKWMAPEAIKEQVYGSKTDVYSFGIVIFEILSGEEPYVDMAALQVAVAVSTNGLRPSLPIDIDPTCTLAKLMYKCWSEDPNQRPTFVEICEFLKVGTPIDNNTPVGSVRGLQVSPSQLARAREGAESIYTSIIAPPGSGSK